MAYADKISLIRHYPHVKNEAYAEYEKLITKKLVYGVNEAEQARINDLENLELRFQKFEELTEDVRQKISRCLDRQNEYLFCYEPGGTSREIDTAHDLIERFDIPEKRILEIEMPEPCVDFWLDNARVYRKRLNSILVRASRSASHIQEIILIGRRSDSYSFLQYAPTYGAEAGEARLILEKQSVVTVDIDGKLYMGTSCTRAIPTIKKNSNSRKLKKLYDSGQITVNGKPAIELGRGLILGDRIRYKNRVVEIGIREDGAPLFIKVSPD